MGMMRDGLMAMTSNCFGYILFLKNKARFRILLTGQAMAIHLWQTHPFELNGLGPKSQLCVYVKWTKLPRTRRLRHGQWKQHPPEPKKKKKDLGVGLIKEQSKTPCSLQQSMIDGWIWFLPCRLPTDKILIWFDDNNHWIKSVRNRLLKKLVPTIYSSWDDYNYQMKVKIVNSKQFIQTQLLIPSQIRGA